MHDLVSVSQLGPVVVHASGVLNVGHREVFRAEAGQSLRQLAPRSNLPTLCLYNGEFAVQDDWDWVPSSEDHVVYVTLPKGGGNASQQVLGVVLIIVGYIVPGAQALIYVGIALLASGLMPAPSYAPLADLSNNAQSPSPTYNISLAGNTARLGQAIPVLYGRHIILPDFASQAYTEFDANDNQFYYALFCLGQMTKFTVETVMIDDTDISHFEEVSMQYVGPNFGPPLSLVHPAVVNAPEVASQDMNFGEYVGPFACCGPGLRATIIGIDITCPKGLYFAEDDGSLGEKSVEWFVEARKITDSGGVAGTWTLIGNESLTAATNKPIRRTFKYTVAAGRYEIRVSRQDVRDDNARAGHDLQWLGMRAYLNSGAPTESSATFLALRIRATSQLSGLSQRRISLILRRWLPSWSPGGGWAAAAETSNPAWALADALRNSDYGGMVPDNRIDLQTLYELSQVWAARGDEFNGIFDKRITLWSALSAIARAGRARPLMRGSVFTFIRDELQDLPVALFTMRNIKRGSFNIEYTMLSDDSTDGLELTYFEETTWSEATIVVKVESDNTLTVVDPDSEDPPASPAKLSYMGITNAKQATREALYTVADAAFRRVAISFVTEMEGYLPCCGDLVGVAHDIAGWGVNGEIEDYDPDTQTAVSTEELSWTVGNNYAVIQGESGDVFGPYLIAPSEARRSFVFLEAPDPAAYIYTGTDRERTRFAMGPANAYAKLCRIVSITPQSNNEVQIRAVVEDARVHAADGGGGGGGGGDGGERLCRYAPDETPVYDAASEAEHDAYGFFTNEDRTVGANSDPGYIYAS